MSAGSATTTSPTPWASPGSSTSPRFEAAVERLLAATRRHGKAAGFLATDVAMARAWRAKGFRCLSYGNDIGLLQGALSEGIGALRNDEA